MASIQETRHGQLACLDITLGDAHLRVARQGAQVLSYQRGQDAPIIWLSPLDEGRPGTACRGGIPVCWPWFGQFDRNPAAIVQQYQGAKAPQHGLVRNQDWQLANTEQSNNSVVLRFAAPQQFVNWPHRAALSLEIELNDRLQLRLINQNLGEQPLHISQALHSYFQVGNIHQAQAEGFADCQYLDTVHSWDNRLTQRGAITFDGETDRIYFNPQRQMGITDPVLNRRIVLSTTGASAAVVWNPWIDKSKQLSQFPEQGWQQMLCIETANVLDSHLILAPGEQQQMAVTIEAQPLA